MEDIARARAERARRDRGLSETRAKVMEIFSEIPLSEFLINYSERANVFVAFVFFETNEILDLAKRNGIDQSIRRAVLEALHAAGRTDATASNLQFEFDSAENVRVRFNGDYFARIG